MKWNLNNKVETFYIQILYSLVLLFVYLLDGKFVSLNFQYFLFLHIRSGVKKRPSANEASKLEIRRKFHRFCRSKANEGYHWVITGDIFPRLEAGPEKNMTGFKIEIVSLHL